MPPSILSITPTVTPKKEELKPSPEELQDDENRSEDADDSMLEMSVDEHTTSMPVKLPVPIMTTKANSIIVHKKKDQLELLRSQLHLNKELIERNNFAPSLSQKIQFRQMQNRNRPSQDLPAKLSVT